MKKIYILLIVLLCAVLFSTCTETDPLTGKTTMAWVSNAELFQSSFTQYAQFINENDEIKTGKDAEMVKRLGDRISAAAQKWYTSIGEPNYLKDYKWEYHLIDDPQVNAWCMPGGKIVVYSGIIPVAGNEDALAVVMGHEVAHALLNHGKQKVSASLLQQLGAMGLSLTSALLGFNQNSQDLFMSLYGVGSTLFGTLPFSRECEEEADKYGLILMAIAGYNPDAAEPFWQNMASMSGGTGSKIEEFLSTHPSSTERAKALKEITPEARRRAAKLRIDAMKPLITQAKKIAAEINKE